MIRVTELRSALRTFRRDPLTSSAAILALALGIGATVTLFSAIDAVLLRPLPVADQERLVILWHSLPAADQPFSEVAYADFQELRRQTRTFEDMAAMNAVTGELSWGTGPDRLRVPGRAVTWSFFETLGVRATLGRTFREADDRPGAPGVVVIGHGFWQGTLGGDPGILGRSVIVDGVPSRVVGVLPPGFEYPRGVQVWTPVAPHVPAAALGRAVRWMVVVGRLRPDADVPQARAEVDVIVAALDAELARMLKLRPETRRTVVTPLVEDLVGRTRPALSVLLAAVALVLLIACADVGGLLLVRGTARQRDTAVRIALGAGRWQILRLHLTESLVLAAAGGALGLLLAAWGVHAIVALGPRDVPRLEQAVLDLRVFAVALAVTGLTALLCGAVPVLQSRRTSLEEALRDGGRGSSEGPGAGRLRGFLVATEVAFALTVLATAALAARSFAHLRGVDLGYDARNLLTLELDGAPEPAQERGAVVRRVLDRIEALPGVQSAAALSLRPLWGTVGLDWLFTLEGQAPEDAARNPIVNLEEVTPGYFRTMGIAVREGRPIDERDAKGAPPVAVVGERLARRCWPGQSAVGKRLKIPYPDTMLHDTWLTVVGVVSDARYRELHTARHDLYLSAMQGTSSLKHLVVRTEGDPAALVPLIRTEVPALGGDLQVNDVQPMAAIVSQALGGPRFGTVLLGVLASVALVLASVGIYGIVAYSVVRRTREIGLRMTLGASRGQVLRLVARETLVPAAVGVGVGLLGAAAAGRGMAGLLFGVAPTDPVTLAVVALLVAAVAVAATCLPALRALRMDPARALRHE
jgi:predicted permease